MRRANWADMRRTKGKATTQNACGIHLCYGEGQPTV